MPSPAEILESLSASGLVSANDLWTVANASPPPADAPACLDALVKRGTLTSFQAQMVLEGRQDELLFGEYLVLDRIGAGGMGEVYKAIHKRMERVVAVKRLPAKLMQSPVAVERFYREVKAAARLTHPNIVAAYDAGESHGSHYLVMEYVEGQDLSRILREQGRLPVGQTIDIIRQASLGLAYAHEKGVIHRDIKPANILVGSDGSVKLLDMGLARVHLAGSALGEADQAGDHTITFSTQQPLTLTKEGGLMGTVDYMSPEQAADAHAADARSDIYSLGCTLYRSLCGKIPFSGSTAVVTILAHTNAPIPLMMSDAPDVPEELEAVYLKMVAKRPQDRFQSMREVIAALDEVSRLAAQGSAPVRAASVSERNPAARVDRSQASPHAPLEASPPTDPSLAAVLESVGSAPVQIPPLPREPARFLTRRRLLLSASVLLLIVVVLVLRGGKPPRAKAPAGDAADAAGPPASSLVESRDPTPAPAEQPGLIIDLLKTIRTQADGSLRIGAGHDAAGLPRFFDEVAVPEEYLLDLEVQREVNSGQSEIVLVVGGQTCSLHLGRSAAGTATGPTRSGLGRLDGRPPMMPGNPTGVEGEFLRDGQWDRVICEVRRDGIRATVNDKIVVNWIGALSRLSPHQHLERAVDKRGPRLGFVQWQGYLHCRKAVLRPLPARVNLLPLIDGSKDAITGTWKLQGGTLRLEAAPGGKLVPFSRLALPVEPPPSYRLRVKFTAGEGRGIGFLLPIAGRSQAFVGIANVGGMGVIDGVAIAQTGNPTSRSTAPLKLGQTHLADITVRTEGRETTIMVLVDQQVFLGWHGESRRLTSEANWAMSSPRTLGLGEWGLSPFVVQEAVLEPLDGSAAINRPAASR